MSHVSSFCTSTRRRAVKKAETERVASTAVQSAIRRKVAKNEAARLAEEKRLREAAEARALKEKIAATQMQTAARGRAARDELTRRVTARHLPY